MSRRLAVPALLTLLLSTLLSIKFLNLPLNRILELRFCLEYYQNHHPSMIPADGLIPERDCKVDVVQERLGWLMGSFDTTVQACDLAIATPMGYLADRVGRRVVLGLNCASTTVLLLWIIFIGGAQSIPPTAILAGPFLSLFGGGNNVFKSVSVALMSDLAETDTQRTSYISYFLSTDYITMLIGPMLAALLMPNGLWLPLWTGVALIGVSLPLLGLVPSRTNKTRRSNSSIMISESEDREHAPLLSDRDSDHETPKHSSSSPNVNAVKGFFAEYLNLLKSSHQFRLLLLAKFLSSFASSSSSLLAIYITMRTGWTYSEVGYIYTLKGMINIFLAVVGVPACARYFSDGNSQDPSIRDSNFALNLVSTRLALLVSVIGAICVGLSATAVTMITSLCIYALGSVLPVFMYAIARSPELGVLNEENEGSGFTNLVVVQALGALLGAPTMAAVWVQAIRIGGYGLGLPYFLSAMAYAAALGTAMFIRAKPRQLVRRMS